MFTHCGVTKEGEKNYIVNDGTSNYNGCFMKTLSGPYKHTGIRLMVSDTNKLSPYITCYAPQKLDKLLGCIFYGKERANIQKV